MSRSSLAPFIAAVLVAGIGGCAGVPANYTTLTPCCGKKDRPVAIRKVAPVEPPIAQYLNVTGQVKLDFTVTARGGVTHVTVVNARFRRGMSTAPEPEMDRHLKRAAINAMYQWKFQPRQVDGNPVATPHLCQIFVF